jgi:hypothetical protein
MAMPIGPTSGCGVLLVRGTGPVEIPEMEQRISRYGSEYLDVLMFLVLLYRECTFYDLRVHFR